MRIICNFIIFPIATILIFYAIPVMSQQSAETNLKAFYEASIDERISKCESKTAALRNSRFANVRSAAEMARLKAAYLSKYKEIIVQDMLDRKIGGKPYKIDHYVNQRFFTIIRPKQALVAEAYSKPPRPDMTDLEKMRLMYSAYVDQCIKRCDAKASMRDSRSKNLRYAAEIGRLKAEFLNDYKELLVTEMIIGQVKMKPYKIDYYINQRFFTIIRPEKVLEAKGYSKSD